MVYPDYLQPLLNKMDPTFGRTIDCGPGWWPLIRECADALQDIDDQYLIYQIKEKFGTLRFYFSTSDPSREQQMRRIVKEFEKRSASTCEESGSQGQLMIKHGRYRTLHSSFIEQGWRPAGTNWQKGDE